MAAEHNLAGSNSQTAELLNLSTYQSNQNKLSGMIFSYSRRKDKEELVIYRLKTCALWGK